MSDKHTKNTTDTSQRGAPPPLLSLEAATDSDHELPDLLTPPQSPFQTTPDPQPADQQHPTPSLSKPQRTCLRCGRTRDQLPPPSLLKRCVQCRQAYFCSETCQRLAWPAHKELCRQRAQDLDRSEQRSVRGRFLKARTGGGTLFTFGSGMFGVLGSGTVTELSEADLVDPTPVPAVRSSKIRSVAMGSTHMLCCTDFGGLLSNGANDRGQLGHGDQQPRGAPAAVSALDNQIIVQVGPELPRPSHASCPPIFSQNRRCRRLPGEQTSAWW